MKSQISLHCLEKEVQNPTRTSFQFHSTSNNEDAQQLENESRLYSAIFGTGKRHCIAGELPVNMSREQFVNALKGLEMKGILHKERNHPAIWSTVFQCQDQTSIDACPTSPVNNGASLSNGFAEESSAIPQCCPASWSSQDMITPQTYLSCTQKQSTSVLNSNGEQLFPEADFPILDKGLIYEEEHLSPTSQDAFGYNSGLCFEDLNGFVGHVNEEVAFKQTVPVSPPLSPPPAASLPPCQGSFTVLELQQGILQYLRSINRPSRALEVSKAVGLTSKKDVNSLLYQLERTGVVYKIHDSQPPMWALSPPKRRGVCGPGVIGEERRRSTNGYDEKISSSVPFPRSHSSNGLVNLGEALYSDGLRSTVRRENARPRARSFGPPLSSSSQESFLRYCEYCKVPLNSSVQTQEHLKSTKHRNKLAKMVFRDYPTFCEYCKVCDAWLASFNFFSVNIL